MGGREGRESALGREPHGTPPPSCCAQGLGPPALSPANRALLFRSHCHHWSKEAGTRPSHAVAGALTWCLLYTELTNG